MVNMFMIKPKWSHYKAAIRILRYVKGTLRHVILFPSEVSNVVELICYSYSDWSGDIVDKRSIT